MKPTTIKVAQDTLMIINRLKYKWCLKSQDAVIRKLYELCSKIESNSNSSTNSSFLLSYGVKPMDSGAGDNNKEKEE